MRTFFLLLLTLLHLSVSAQIKHLWFGIEGVKIKQPIPLQLKVYEKNGMSRVIHLDTLRPGTTGKLIVPEDEFGDFKGFMEIELTGLGMAPIVVYQPADTLFVKTRLENLQASRVQANINADHAALAAFQDKYQVYENSFNALWSYLMYAQDTTYEVRLDRFLTAYYNSRIQLNLGMDTLRQKYPKTYVSDVLADFFYFPTLGEKDTLNLRFIRNHYFDKWKYEKVSMLNNPLLDRQLTIFLTNFAFDEQGLREGINAVLLPPIQRVAQSDIRTYLVEFVLMRFVEMQDGSMDEYIQYVAENFGEGCGGGDANGQDYSSKVKKIDNVRIGRNFPDIEAPNALGQKQKLSSFYSPEKHNLVVIWAAGCSHCMEFLPEIEKLARKYPDKLNVYAFSVDIDKEKWLKAIEPRKNLKNWLDVSEIGGFKSPALSEVFFFGTPSLFLLSPEGKIISRTKELQDVEKSIQ